MTVSQLSLSTRGLYFELVKLKAANGHVPYRETQLVELVNVSFPLLSKCLKELTECGLVKRTNGGFYFPYERRKNDRLRQEIKEMFARWRS